MPEDIEAELVRAFADGFAGFRGGATMPIGGLVLSKDTPVGRFVVYCYSDKYFQQNITQVSGTRDGGSLVADGLSFLLRLRNGRCFCCY
jgi:hypothetical protein